MIKRSHVVVLAILCLLALGATASSASAEQRAYVCSKGASTKAFSDAHCLSQAEPKEYGHTLITTESEEITLANEKTASETTTAQVMKFKGVLFGVSTEIQCSGLQGVGALTNAAASVTFKYVITYTGCTVTSPSGKGCVVKGGSITTNELSATTVGQAANQLKITPASGTEFWTLTIEKCSIGTLNNSFPVTGSFVASTSGATVTTTHTGITTQNTLKIGGTKAGIEGAMTISTEETSQEVVEGLTLTSVASEQRAYTCSKGASTKEFSDAHCLNKVEAGEYGHTLITEENAKATVSNEKTAGETKSAETSKLKGQLSGIATEVQCTGVHGTGTLTNAATSVSGSGTIKYTGCTVTAPAGKGCKVEGGAITTETLSASTAGQATGTMKLSPKSPATRFALVSIESCAEGLPADGFYPVTGSLVAKVSGATITTTHADTTEQGTLKFGGVKAGVEGALTMSREGGDPIALTASTEQQAYACSKGASKLAFGDAHCLNAGGVYGHASIVGKQEMTVTNESTGSETKSSETWKLKGQLTGVITEVQCTGAHGTGSLTNASESVSGEGVIKYTGCTVTAPAGKGCKVEGGTVSTETLVGTTVGQAANTLKLSPKSPATKFAQVSIEGCAEGVVADANYPVTGSLVAKVGGATITTTHAGATEQGTLKFGGVKAGIEGALTARRTTTVPGPGEGITFT